MATQQEILSVFDRLDEQQDIAEHIEAVAEELGISIDEVLEALEAEMAKGLN